MSYTITQDTYTTLYNMRAQLQLVASLASQSEANDMQELSVFLEVMAADAQSVLVEAAPVTDRTPRAADQTASQRISPRKREKLVERAAS